MASLAMVGCTGGAPAAQPDPPESTEAPTPQTPTDDTTDEPTREATDEPTDKPTKPPIAEPKLPISATKPTRQGAEAFVEYYVELLNYARVTGDITPLRSATRNCHGCSLFADLYKRTYQRGGSFRGLDWNFRSLVTYDVRDDYYTLATIKASAGTYFERADVEPEKFLETEYSYRFVSTLTGASWVMTGMVRTDV